MQWASRTLDAERATWRPIVALNVIRGLASLFDQLETAFEQGAYSPSLSPTFRSDQEYPYTSRSSSPGSSAQDHSHYSSLSLTGPILDPAASLARDELFYYREALHPLIAMEDALLSSISGMVRAVGGIYLRSDWQATFPRHQDHHHSSKPSSPNGRIERHGRDMDTIQAVQTLLSQSRDYIRGVWTHSYLPGLLKSRVIKLEDSTALCAIHTFIFRLA